MNNEVVNKIQEAMNAYKNLFHEEIDTEKQKDFENLFKVIVDENKELYIDDFCLGLKASDCKGPIYYVVDPHVIYIRISDEKILLISVSWGFDLPLPQLYNAELFKAI